MTAPGQEPDEVMTAKPDEGTDTEESTRSPDLDAVGDRHMPEDLRQAEREKVEDEEVDDSKEEGDPEDGEGESPG